MKKILLISAIAIIATLAACSSSSSDDDDTNEPPPDNSAALQTATDYYNDNLQVFITTNCVSCHEGQHNKSNSSNYGVFTNARNAASNMFNQVNSGAMPKGAAKLPASDIDKFQEFRDLVNAIN
ncbi:MAG: hypothetical protein JKX79_07205 [Labilibaculum sp.]|nr:hypothetical protein [Labilibaculum sp.]